MEYILEHIKGITAPQIDFVCEVIRIKHHCAASNNLPRLSKQILEEATRFYKYWGTSNFIFLFWKTTLKNPSGKNSSETSDMAPGTQSRTEAANRDPETQGSGTQRGLSDSTGPGLQAHLPRERSLARRGILMWSFWGQSVHLWQIIWWHFQDSTLCAWGVGGEAQSGSSVLPWEVTWKPTDLYDGH